MAKAAMATEKLIVGIIIAILAASAILVAVSAMLLSDLEKPGEPTSVAIGTVATGETGSEEPTGGRVATGETGSREPQGEKNPSLPDYDSRWIDDIYKIGEYRFTVIHISDTQFLSMHDQWGNFTSWLASVAEEYNVKMIIHTGDIVQHWNDMTEWERANASMGVLLDSGVPYAWCTGNHDFLKSNYLGANYVSFNISTFESKDYWLDSYDQQNTAVKWTYGNYKFVVINLAWHCNSSAMAWFTKILETNTDANIIVATHSFINNTGGYNLGFGGDAWELALMDILNENPNVMFTLNGHDVGVYETTVNDREQILFNYQGTNARVARIMTFDLTSNTVYVWTYFEYSGKWDFSSENTFSFGVELI